MRFLYFKKVFLLFFLCLFLNAQEKDYSLLYISKDEFVKLSNKALKLQLYKDKEWLNLLHFNNKKSQINNEYFNVYDEKEKKVYKINKFFYSNTNKDAKEELLATLFALYIKKDFYKNKKIKNINKQSALIFDYSNDNLHAICRFALRKEFLEKKLNLTNLLSLNCSDFNKLKDYLNINSASIVFASSYINSPASMFGHTFLLFNDASNNKLLSYAINFAADVDENKQNPFVFMYKGLFGGYLGKYSIRAYYDMIKSYKDNENRDLYEYDLKLTKIELERLLKHFWELKDSSSSYLFLSNNCSYNILWLLENAKKDLDLRKDFFISVFYYKPCIQ